jgi:hypothetical protein
MVILRKNAYSRFGAGSAGRRRDDGLLGRCSDIVHILVKKSRYVYPVSDAHEPFINKLNVVFVPFQAGSTHTLPHLQTSPLPTPGSSGGPIVRLDTGTVVGLTSGTRMDNRVEGERGWGATAEGVFEVSLC